ncbi:MAG: hypothetical protein AB1758_27620 [Candidatus Eremiobacterota bacterium]
MAGSLLLLVLGCTYQVLTRGMRYMKEADATLEVQQQTLLGLVWVTNELAESSPDSVQFSGGSEPPGISFASARDPSGKFTRDDDGFVQWQGVICYYLDGTDLVRKQVATGTSSTPPTRAVGWFVSSSIRPRVVARHVSRFECSGTKPVSLVIEAAKQELGEDFRVEVDAQILAKN